jgi:hypothetical protein
MPEEHQHFVNISLLTGDIVTAVGFFIFQDVLAFIHYSLKREV